MASETRELRVKVVGQESLLTLSCLAPEDTLAEVAAQVRKAHGWDAQQHMRFISGGAELFQDDSVERVFGQVLHCIASQSPAQKYPAPKAGSGQKGVQHSPAADWLEMVDPGTVLMWIFGAILSLLWLLFLCYAHMFDRTSVIMLCMMTIAFLIPCVLSYVPALRMLQGPGFSSLAPRHSSSHSSHSYSYHHHHHSSSGRTQGTGAGGPASTPPAGGGAGAGGGWSAYSTAGGAYYTGAIPPRPAARVRPGQPAPQ